ncbi:Ubiquitin carboxyl-terminal hydrolase 19 [Phytophthora nicotianae]|uniref:Ubiquitin carboxyl-terminal hydrolase 19 n=1 Tax=Phytophthora nicotianae TaxID=4792 RepID=A0A0W8C4Q9_PHYNI|nr:Ubiquitin carboxyl-terminal hydrolase 19 [Phytophthora nicotianae]
MATGEQYLTKNYEKWNNFQDDSDSDNEDVPRVPTQFDVEGDADIVISTEMLLTLKQVERYRKLEKKQLEVWQVVVRQLRICDPPEVYPSPQTVLDLTLQAMLDPPTNTPQHRPDKIVFPDKNFVGQLRKSYSSLGIECSYLSESDGIDAYIQELSQHLIRKDLASVAEVSERAGLISGAGVTTEALAAFYSACEQYAKLEPWDRLAERQAIQVDAVGDEELRLDARHHVGRGTVFSSVISTRTGGGPNGEGGDHIRGMALFYTRADLERRVLPPGEQLALMENPELRRCAKCDKRAAPGKELKRCTRCKCTFYCDAQCQRGHWKDHKVSCTPPGSTTSGPGEHKIVWGAKEMSILYGPQTSVPFDDLDVITKHSLPIAKVKGEFLYPSAVVFRKGDPSVPDVSELAWLTRALNAQIELVGKQPLFMQDTMGELLGLDDSEPRKLELQCKTLGHDDHLVIRNSTVLTMHDVERLRKVIKKQQVGAQKDEGETQEANETKDESDDDGADLQDGEKGCNVM